MPKYSINDTVRFMNYNPDGTVRYCTVRILDVNVTHDEYVYKFLQHDNLAKIGTIFHYSMWEVERASELISHGTNTAELWEDINE